MKRDRIRRTVKALGCLCVLAVGGPLVPMHLSAQDAGGWVVPRTEYGHPDLQGNWTNATMTPVQRPAGQDRVLSAEQVAELEGGQAAFIEEQIQDSDPDRDAPPVGGVAYGQPLLDAASGGTGGYNFFFIDPGSRVAVYDGEPRSSLVTTPENGQIPPLTPEAQQRIRGQMAAARQFGEYDNPENRPLSDRCIMSFGSNAGPPMLPNYFYNNNYTIVQTADYVMIMTEMVHDARIIPLGEPRPLPEDIRPWMGNSWGYWAGDTLVVETTQVRPEQLSAGGYVLPGGGSDAFRVIERLTRADENTINYEFTIIDPATYTQPWGGQVPFVRQPGLIYEYACHEGNYAMVNILSGARAEEREESGAN
jgi:hypothetical protein